VGFIDGQEPYSRTAAIFELTRQTTGTWPEEWRIETEAQAILKMSKGERRAFLNGLKDQDGKTIDRGVVAIRGLKTAEEIRRSWSGGLGPGRGNRLSEMDHECLLTSAQITGAAETHDPLCGMKGTRGIKRALEEKSRAHKAHHTFRNVRITLLDYSALWSSNISALKQ
jgi:hypothetical protein